MNVMQVREGFRNMMARGIELEEPSAAPTDRVNYIRAFVKQVAPMLGAKGHAAGPLADVLSTAMEILTEEGEHDTEEHPHLTARQIVVLIRKFMDEMVEWARTAGDDGKQEL